MKIYYVDKNLNKNDYHELHVATCRILPNLFHRKYLGKYQTSAEAMKEAKKHFSQLEICTNCIPEPIEIKLPFYKRWFKKK